MLSWHSSCFDLLGNRRRLVNCLNGFKVFPCIYEQARNQGVEAPLEKCLHPPGKMCWTSFKTIGHSSKNLAPSQKTLCPSWYPKLVMSLYMNQTYILATQGWSLAHLVKYFSRPRMSP